MTVAEIPDWARSMLDRERVARLAYLDGHDHPRVLPVTFALTEGALWSAIDDKPKQAGEPARVRWLRRRGEAALTVDRYDDDWTRLAWVQLLGEISVLDGSAAEAQEGLDALLAKYEQYRDRRPTGPVLRLDVERALCWRAAD